MVRRVWRQARSPQGKNTAWAKLNKGVDRSVAQNSGIVVHHRELESVNKDLVRPDGVHLNTIRRDMWALDLLGGIEQAFSLWRDDHT